MSRIAIVTACAGVVALAFAVQAQDESGIAPARRQRATSPEGTRYGGSRGDTGQVGRGMSSDEAAAALRAFQRQRERRESAPAATSSTYQTVVFDVVIADVAKGTKDVAADDAAPEKLLAKINDLEQRGELESIGRARLATIDQQSCMVQIGQRQPVPARISGGASSDGRARLQTSYTFENTGTMINIVPRVERDNSVIAEISVERTRIEPQKPKDKDAADADFTPSVTTTMSGKTTIRVANNATMVLNGMHVSGKSDSQHTIVLVTAHVTGEPMRAATAPEAVDVGPERESHAGGPNVDSLLRGEEAHPAAKPVEKPAVESPRLNAERAFLFKNRKAGEVAKVIAPLFAGEAIRVTVDDRTNSLLIRANAEVMQKIEATLEELDNLKPAQR